MRYFLHPLIDEPPSQTDTLFVLMSEENHSYVVKEEHLARIAEKINSYLADGHHDNPLSWSEYKNALKPKLTTISKALSKAKSQGIKTPTSRAIRKWIVQGQLPAQKVGRAWQFKESDFFAVLQAKKTKRQN